MRAHPAGPRHADLTRDAAPAAPASDLGRLDARVWPRSAAREGGSVQIGGVDVRALAAEFGTPLFVLDEDDFRSRCRDFREAFDAEVYYAAKAFLSTEIARWVADEGLSLDVSTGGELAVALAAGFPPGRIVMHGNNKSVRELSRAIDAGVGRIVLDSIGEIDRLADLAAERGHRQGVLVRATVGVEAHTHEFIATAHEDQKFGFSLASGAAAEAVRLVLSRPSLDLVGVHAHIGSQIFDTAGFEVSAHRVVGLLAQIRDEHGIDLPELDLGGGFGIAYVEGDDPPDIVAVAKALAEIVDRECAGHGLAVPRLAVEPGRAIAGPGAVTVYEVGTVKPVTLDGGLQRAYVSVDGGMSDNIRTALYGAEYSVVLASRPPVGAPMLSRVVGKHCESGDIVVRDAWLPDDLTPGDLLAVPATGAYCRSMASNYTPAPRPPVVAVRGGSARLIVRRETEDDLLRLDCGVSRG